MSELFKSACSGAHILVFVLSLVPSLVIVGVSWGTLSARISSLEEALKEFRAEDGNWKAQEWNTDNIHRQRMNDIEKEFREILRLVK